MVQTILAERITSYIKLENMTMVEPIHYSYIHNRPRSTSKDKIMRPFETLPRLNTHYHNNYNKKQQYKTFADPKIAHIAQCS